MPQSERDVHDLDQKARHFPPPWSVDDADMKLGQTCFIIRDADGHALAFVYFEEEPAGDRRLT